jgi:hypothetical protein
MDKSRFKFWKLGNRTLRGAFEEGLLIRENYKFSVLNEEMSIGTFPFGWGKRDGWKSFSKE